MNLYNYILQQGKWVFSGRIIVLFLSFLLNIIIVNNISTLQYGKYQYFLSVLGIFSIFSFTDFKYSYLRFSDRNNPNSFYKFFYSRLFFSFLFFVLILFILLVVKQFSEIENFFTYLFVILFFPFYYSFDTIQSYFVKNEDFFNLNKIHVIISIFNFFTIGLVAYYLKSFQIMAIFFLLNPIIIHIYVFKKVILKSIFNIFSITNNFIKKNQIKYTLLLTLFSIPIIIVDYFDKLLIGKYIGFENLAFYALGVSFSKQILMIFKEISNVLMPKLVHFKLGKKNYILILIIGTLIGSLLSFISDYLFEFFYGKKYLISSTYAKIIFYSLGFYLIATIITNEFKLNKNHNINVIYSVNIFNPLIQILITLLILFSKLNVDLKLIYLSFLIAFRDVSRIILIILTNKLLKKYKWF